MWVEYVVGSRLAPRVFLWVLQFSSLHKNQHAKFQIDPEMTASGLSALLLSVTLTKQRHLFILSKGERVGIGSVSRIQLKEILPSGWCKPILWCSNVHRSSRRVLHLYAFLTDHFVLLPLHLHTCINRGMSPWLPRRFGLLQKSLSSPAPKLKWTLFKRQGGTFSYKALLSKGAL